MWGCEWVGPVSQCRLPGSGPHPALSREREREKGGSFVCSTSRLLASLLDRALGVRAPFGVRGGIELDLLIAERFQGEIRVGGADAGAAVGEDRTIGRDALAAYMARRSAGDFQAPPLLGTALSRNGILTAPGMWPLAYSSAVRASTSAAEPVSEACSTSSSRARVASFGVPWYGCDAGAAWPRRFQSGRWTWSRRGVRRRGCACPCG